jgi:hypothetical protein
MEEVLKGGSGAVFLFLYLFPGFLGTLVYDFLVEGQRPENFERIVAALALTLVTSALIKFVFGLPLLPLAIDDKAPVSAVIDGFVGSRLLWGTLGSVVLAAGFAALNNSGALYKFLGAIGLTYKESSRDVWSDTFRKYRGEWVRINFADGRSLIGWPRFYSKSGDPREIFIAEATWWTPDDAGAVSMSDVSGPGVYLSDFAGVTSIELLK